MDHNSGHGVKAGELAGPSASEMAPRDKPGWEAKRTSEEHGTSIKRREAYFDLLVSGSSIEQTAGDTNKNSVLGSSRDRPGLAKRQLDAPEDYALQVARLTKALRCADVSLGTET